MIKFSSADETALENAVRRLPEFPCGTQVIGPANASLYKANDIYNKVLYVKSADYNVLTDFAQRMERLAREEILYKKVSVQFDFNPLTS